MKEQADRSPAALESLHTVPTHLATVDTVVSLGTFSLSSRQLVLLLVSGSISVTLWTRTAVLVFWLPPLGELLHWIVVLVAVTSTLALAFGQVAGRSFESWLGVLLAYIARPHLYLWRGWRALPGNPGNPIEDEANHADDAEQQKRQKMHEEKRV